VVQVTTAGGLRLGNQGDTVVLVDGNSGSIDQVTYKTDWVRPGRTICFGR
jgi:phosphatidylserine decarboxylase